jgi:hypothetical protein
LSIIRDLRSPLFPNNCPKGESYVIMEIELCIPSMKKYTDIMTKV